MHESEIKDLNPDKIKRDSVIDHDERNNSYHSSVTNPVSEKVSIEK